MAWFTGLPAIFLALSRIDLAASKARQDVTVTFVAHHDA